MRGTPSFNIGHIELMHNGANDQFVSFDSNDCVQIHDILQRNLTSLIKNCLKAFYKSKVEKNQKLDGYNCGLFAIAFATDVLNGLFPVDSCFDVSLMRSHLLQRLETEELTVYPKTLKRIRATHTALKVLKI